MNNRPSETAWEPVTAYLALGSNLGDREEHLRRAVAALRRHPNVDVVAVSRVYETRARTLDPGDAQPHYLNAVVKLDTTLEPRALLEAARRIERDAGRERPDSYRWAPRTLDIDILIFGQEEVLSADLTIPHPRMGERAFVLRPLADVAPHEIVPAPFEASVEELLSACSDRDEPALTAVELS